MVKILIIDDEQGVCDVLKEALEQEGHLVSATTDPVKGVEWVVQQHPRVVLLDLKMPGMDGVEVLTKIKDFDKGIQVIMITGHGDIENAMDCVNIGAYDYIAKPFDLDFIKELVKRCLKA